MRAFGGLADLVFLLDYYRVMLWCMLGREADRRSCREEGKAGEGMKVRLKKCRFTKKVRPGGVAAETRIRRCLMQSTADGRVRSSSQ